MALTVSENSFIDVDDFNLMAGSTIVPVSSSTQSADELRLITLINTVILFMEKFCDTLLKARDFSYVVGETAYNPEYSIFDPPEGTSFWFPVIPVNSITTFLISDEVITPATTYEADDGYVLYSQKGNLFYYGGFDYGYRKNIKIKWNGGIVENTNDYTELQYLQYLFVKYLWDDDPVNDNIISETFSNYAYKKSNVKDLAEYLGIPMFVFNRLYNFKRHNI
jgi:hypothetical protein